MKSEGKAKVVAAAWGAEFIKYFATLAILHQDDLKNHPFLQIILVQNS